MTLAKGVFNCDVIIWRTSCIRSRLSSIIIDQYTVLCKQGFKMESVPRKVKIDEQGSKRTIGKYWKKNPKDFVQSHFRKKIKAKW